MECQPAWADYSVLKDETYGSGNDIRADHSAIPGGGIGIDCRASDRCCAENLSNRIRRECINAKSSVNIQYWWRRW